jgi:hypothetical protein
MTKETVSTIMTVSEADLGDLCLVPRCQGRRCLVR